MPGTAADPNKSYRNLIVEHDDLHIPEVDCAALQWPACMRYVTWTYLPDSGMFRAYIEFKHPSTLTVLSAIPSQRILYDSQDRDLKRAAIRAHGHKIWEDGSWEAGKRGPKPGLRELIAEQQQRLDEQAKEIAELKAQPPAVHMHNNIVINIQSYGYEDTSYIPIETQLRRCLAKLPGLVETIRDVHMNPAHPQNHNVRMVSKRRNTAAIRLNGAWKQEPTSHVVAKLMWSGYKNIMRYLTAVPPDEMTPEHKDAQQVLLATNINGQKRDVVEARQRVRTMLLDTPKLEKADQ